MVSDAADVLTCRKQVFARNQQASLLCRGGRPCPPLKAANSPQVSRFEQFPAGRLDRPPLQGVYEIR